MIQSLRFSLAIAGVIFAVQLLGQPTPNNTLRGRVLYQSSGNKPAAGVRVAEPDANAVYSVDNGDYRLTFQTKRNGAALVLEVGKDNNRGQKLELVNEKEVKAAKLPASAEEFIDIIVCFAGQRDIAAQKYYRILRTTADRELERKKKEVEDLLEQKEKDYQKISDLFALIDRIQAALDSAKIREQAFSIASINLDRASQMVKDAVKKIDEENDVEGALKILNAEALDTAYEHASALKKQADAAIKQVIEGYELKASLLEPQYKYGEAAECYEKIAGICEKEEYDKRALATYLSMTARNWEENGEYQKALEFTLKTLSLRKEILPANDPNLALSYNNLAVIYYKLGEYQKALELNFEALSIWEKMLPVARSDLASSYSNLAATYCDLGDYQKALDYNQKALAIREKVLPVDHSDLALSYNNLAFTYAFLGEYQKQLEFNLKSLSIWGKILPADHPDLASLYNNFAATYAYLGDHRKALEFNLKATAIREKVLSANHPDLAASYSSLSANYSHLDELSNALKFELRSLAIREKVLPIDHPDLAWSFNSLSATYSRLGDYQTAIEFSLKSLSIWEKTLPVEHLNLVWSYNNLSGAYSRLGDYQKTLEFELKALSLREKALPADHPDIAMSYSSVAEAYYYLGEHQKTLDLHLKALAIREKSLPFDHPNLAISYTYLGRSYCDIGDFEKGIEYGQKAINIGEASNPKHLRLNRFYANLGITYVKARQYPEAKAALEKSQRLKEEERVYRGWAMYYASQKKKKQAIESLQKAVALGFKDLKWLETEPDLKNIRKEEGYKELVEQLKK